MYEGIFLAALVVLVVWAIRPGKTVQYDSPIVIHKPALYHATLAPQLLRVQNLIEQIASHFSFEYDIATQYFKVRDQEGDYLFAAGYRAGVLYFQALPASDNEEVSTLRRFSEAVMVHIPLVESQSAGGLARLRTTVTQQANRLQITCLEE